MSARRRRSSPAPPSALVVARARTRAGSRVADQFTRCSNGCTASGGGYREANHVATFLGTYRFDLCAACARTWRTAWEAEVTKLVDGSSA